jgi:hypothetical protein
MRDTPMSVPSRTTAEWELYSRRGYDNPFADVRVEGEFTSPSGATYRAPGFYDGDIVWRVRFNPNEPGAWTYRISSRSADPELAEEGSFEVTPRETRGFLKATPGQVWGFEYEDGTPAFLFGDTVYNLFGMAYCGIDVVPFLERRARQGFNLLRVRLPVSLFHPPDGYNQWQTHRTWPWGGSEQAPLFDRFNLPYFRVVDRVVRECDRLGLGLEMIMQAWGFEFPFAHRDTFLPEWEELWMRWLIARYDAHESVYFWTLMNEYEYYPNGDWHYKPVADRWAMRLGRWMKREAQHGHVISVHNGPPEPPFARRFAADPEAIDAVMFQTWGTTGEEDSWLAAGIEEQIERSLEGWWGSAVFAEWGYERNPELELRLPNHRYCDPEHTRRGAWRGAMTGLGIIHGFDNSWGPWAILHQDQPGMQYLLHLHRFFTEHAPFHELRPAPELIPQLTDYAEWDPSLIQTALATPSRDLVVVYLPLGGSVQVVGDTLPVYRDVRSYDPRTGAFGPVESRAHGWYEAPEWGLKFGWDWVLLLSAREDMHP